MEKEQVVIVGGSGFVGGHLTQRLLREGYRVRILTRHNGYSDEARLPAELELLQCDVHDQPSLNRAFKGCKVVINLVGILNERGHNGHGFYHAHVALTHKIVEACRVNCIERLLHMSALGADAATGTSFYLRSKGEAEHAVHISGLKVTIFRPSVIFGKGDSFLNRFAALLKIPGPFPLACASARFAPIWVGDVVECFVQSLANEATIGKRYNLCGPHEYTLEELVSYTAGVLGKKKWIIPLGDTLSAIQARVLEWVPGKPFSRDNFNSTRTPSVCEGEFPAIFGITPHTLESIAEDYLSV